MSRFSVQMFRFSKHMYRKTEHTGTAKARLHFYKRAFVFSDKDFLNLPLPGILRGSIITSYFKVIFFGWLLIV